MKKIYFTTALLLFVAQSFAQIPDPCTGANAAMIKSTASPCNCEEAQIGSSCNKSVYANQAGADADIQNFFNTQFGFGQPNIPVAWQDVRSSNMMVDVAAPGIKHEFSTEFTTGLATTSLCVINIFQVRSGCAGACQNYIITKKADPCGTNLITPTLVPSGTTPAFNYRCYAVTPNTTYIITRQVVYDATSLPCFTSWTGTDGSVSGGAKVTAQHWFIWSSGVILPVKDLQLSARQLHNNIMVQWTTNEEFNTANFDIEKSIDGINFTKIAEATAAGNSVTSRNYFIEDKIPASINYYRVKAIDKDGKAGYSKIVKLVFNANDKTTIIISPNPVNTNADIIIETKSVTTSFYNILNSKGQIVQKGKLVLQKGINKITQNLSSFSAGIYLFIAEINGEKTTLKFIKK